MQLTVQVEVCSTPGYKVVEVQHKHKQHDAAHVVEYTGDAQLVGLRPCSLFIKGMPARLSLAAVPGGAAGGLAWMIMLAEQCRC